MVRSSPASWSGLDVLEPRQLLAFAVWDGGGGDSNWHNPLNWSSDTLPGAGDNVLIDTVGHPTIHRSANVSDTIASLWSLNPIDISGGSLTVNGQWRQSAALVMSAGSVHGGNLIINGDALWIGGTIDGGSNILIYPGRQLSIGGDVSLGRSIYNNGSLRWTAGNITTDGGTIQNLDGKSFVIQSAGTLHSSGAATRLINYGTITREGDPATTSTIDVIFSNYSGWIFFPPIPNHGPGTVEVQAGTLSFTNTVVEKVGDTLTGMGTWSVSGTTGRLLLPGQDITSVEGSVILSGAAAAFPQIEGAARIANLTLSGGRGFTFTNLGLSTFGNLLSLVIDNPGLTMNLPRLSMGLVTVRGGTVNFSQGIANATTLEAGSGATLILGGASSFDYIQFTGAGLIRITGDVAWVNGVMDGAGQTIIGPTGSVHTRSGQYWSPSNTTISRRTVNYGAISLQNGSIFQYGGTLLSLSGELVNRGILYLDINGYVATTLGVGPGSAPGIIQNFGTLNTSDTLTFRGAGGGVKLVNMGTVNVNAGVLVLNGGVGGGGNWNTADGATLTFGGLGSVLNGAHFTGIGQVREAAEAYWTNTSLSGAWQFYITPVARFTMIGAANSFAPASVRNDGIFRFQGNAAAQVSGMFYNSGTLDVGTGLLHITQDLNLNPSSIVRIRSTAPSDPPRITVSGNTDLKGSVVVSFTWSPQVGDTYDYMTFGSYTHGFSSAMAEGVPMPGIPMFIYGGTSARVGIGIF